MKQLIIFTFIFFAGCQSMRQTAIDISIENAKNAETIREVSNNCKDSWLTISGFVKGLLANRMNELPNEIIEAIKELDELAAKEELTDYELGYFLGLQMSLWGSVAQTAIEKYAPNAVGYLPLLF